MTERELVMLQSLPLDIKVAKTKLRIEEFVRYQGGEDKVYISFSGGKDSTVLLNIAREIFPNIKAVFVDTGLEFPELKDHVKTFDNVEILRPKMGFKQVIEKYGYPVVSKEQSRYLYDVRNSKSEKLIKKRLEGSEMGGYKISEKWKYLIDSPFKISDKCCNVMKKAPFKKYEKETGRSPIVGMLAEESRMRKLNYMNTGCNSFDNARPMSRPLGFWREEDILEYISTNNIEIPSIYGEVVKSDSGYNCTGYKRTGCVFCMYGIHLEKGENRFQKLQKTHPQLHKYCMDKLGFKDVCDYMGIPSEEMQYSLFGEIDRHEEETN